MIKLVNTGAEKLRYTNDELEKYVEKCTQDIIDLCPISQQTKQEWSEEDEIYLQDALWCVKQASKIARGENDMGACRSAERWLKSLKNRGNSLKSNTNSPSWKPSEVQLEALQNAEKYLNAGLQYGSARRIAELIEQLKKLRVKEEPEHYQHFDPDC